MSENKDVIKYLGKVYYDQHGQMIFTKKDNQMVADSIGDGNNVACGIRGWGNIQNLFKDQNAAANFQDKIGQFITDAINEKIERESN